MVKNLADEHGAENLIIIFGINQPSTLQIMTRTFTSGDPSYAGPLAGTALNLPCYHILELKDQIPEEVWQAEMSMYELQIEEEEKAAIVKAMIEGRNS